MAPEQATGDALTPAADVWGIGAVLFEAACGRAPFKAYAGERYEQIERRADSIRSVRRLPAPFASTLDGCLHPEPGDRPSAEELLTILARLI